MIQQTSISAYTELCTSRYVAKKTLEYLSSLSTFTAGASDREVAERLGWPPGRVSARRNNAQKMNLIVQKGSKIDENTHKRVIVWGVRRK